MPKACVHNSVAHLVDLRKDNEELLCGKEIDSDKDSELISREVYIDVFLEELEEEYDICEGCLDEVDDLHLVKEFLS